MSGKSKSIKAFAMGMLTSLIIVTSIVTVNAGMSSKNIEVFTGVNLSVDDNPLNPKDANGDSVEAFIYNGTTYLPVRAVADAFEKAVAWDGSTSTVYLGKHDSNEPVAMLSDLDYFNASQDDVFEYFDYYKDNFGNEYNDAVVCNVGGSRWQEYNINGQYSSMKGKVVLNYKYRTTPKLNKVVIYGDGEELYSASLSGGSDNSEFDIDLTGVLKLKVVIDQDFGGTAYRGGSEYIGIINTGLYN